ncbi:MAG: hypothetical protein AAGA86_11265 [Bacteroidota bacterium]
MAVLKKRITASTLMETLVATVLIVIIFMVSSMVLNNLLKGKGHDRREALRERIHVLEYQYKNGALVLPYWEDFGPWQITIAPASGAASGWAVLIAAHIETGKTLTENLTHVD